MKKNMIETISNSYEQFHLKESQVKTKKGAVSVSPKLKLLLGWSFFILCCVLAYVVVGLPFDKKGELSAEDKQAVLEQEVDVSQEHDTIVPLETDANRDLNSFLATYLQAVTDCDNEALQNMVTDTTPYETNEDLKRKAEFITAYDDMTVYTKAGLEEGSYVAFVVTTVTIAGVNSKPYDIATYYIVNGERGYRIQNGTLSQDTQDYIDKIKGDSDIQKIYKSVEEENSKLRESDTTLQEFYDIISRQNVETNAAADTSTQQDTTTETSETEAAVQEEQVQETE